jgi:hypothetical protein
MSTGNPHPKQRSVAGKRRWLRRDLSLMGALIPALFMFSTPAAAQGTCSARCPDGSMSETYSCSANYVPRCYRRGGNIASGPDRRQQEIQRQQLQQQQELMRRQAEEAERKRKASEADQMGMDALNRGDNRAAVNHLLAALESDPQNAAIRAHLDRANKALQDELEDARAAADLLRLRQEIEDATAAADLQATREELEDEMTAQQLAAISKDLRGHTWRQYRLSGNGFIGGTSWLVGYNVQDANPAILAKEKQMLQKQMELSGKEYDGVDFSRYNFVLGIGASTNILLDLKNRVIFDEFKNGQFSAREQALYASLKDRQFGELACHSNGAMICLAALENQDVIADRVVLYGPQITRESLQMWNELVRSGYVKSLDIYVNENDPVPPFSLALGDLFSNVPEQAELLSPNTLKKLINETSPKIAVHTFSCGADSPTLDCHDMKVYKRDRGCFAKPSGKMVPGTALPGKGGVIEPPLPYCR